MALAGSLLVVGYEQAEEHAAAEKSAGAPAEKKDAASTRSANQGPLSNAELAILRSLEKRRDVLDAQEKELRRREDRVKLAEKTLEVRMEELKKLRAELTALYEEDKKSRDDKFKMMTTSICINMKPDQSAAILSKMDDEIVLKMFGMIPDKQLSKILEKMDKQKAADLSAAFVKQKRTLPKPPDK